LLLIISTYSAARIFLLSVLLKFAAPLTSLTPTQRWLRIQLADGSYSHAESNACTLRYGFYPRSKMATQATAYGPFLG